jgi:opacity protein-like surface antigen
MKRSLGVAVGIVGLLAAAVPGTAAAQMLGVGPRFSMVRGDLATKTPTTRFVGGTVRVNLAKIIGLEGSLDFRTTSDLAKTQRLRETPLQGSVMFYPFRSMLSPYALGGLGIYSRTSETLGAGGVITKSTSERKTGLHVGFGGELRVARHAVAYADYRYRFVKFGEGAVLVPGVSSLKFSHQGSMWTGGVAFVF